MIISVKPNYAGPKMGPIRMLSEMVSQPSGFVPCDLLSSF